MREHFLLVSAATLLGSCAHAPLAPAPAAAPEIRVEFMAESAVAEDMKVSLVLSSPEGSALWSARWPITQGNALRNSFPYAGSGDYSLRATWEDEGPGSVVVGVPVRRADDVVDLKVLLGSPAARIARADVVGHVWGVGSSGVRIDTLVAPDSGKPASYRVTNTSGAALPSMPFWSPQVLGPQLLSSARPVPPSGTPGLQERVRLCPGTFAKLRRESRQGPWAPQAVVTLDEARYVCGYRALPPGEYAQVILLDEGPSRPGTEDSIARTEEFRVPFQVPAGARLPPPRRVFPSVSLSRLAAAADAGARIFDELDGGSVCVCEGALVGREGLPILELKPNALVLEGDGGVRIQLPTNSGEATPLTPSGVEGSFYGSFAPPYCSSLR